MQNEFKLSRLSNLSDEDLTAECKINKLAASVLISRYAKIICKKAVARSNAFIDSEDLMQEGLIGLFNAITTYNKDHGTKFSTYANVCITNNMTTALLKNNYNEIPIDSSDIDDEDESVCFFATPESILLEKEMLDEMYKKISCILSDMEWQIFQLFLTGSTYDQMARQLNISPKMVDNAIQRVRRKLKSVWRVEEFSN